MIHGVTGYMLYIYIIYVTPFEAIVSIELPWTQMWADVLAAGLSLSQPLSDVVSLAVIHAV